MLQIRRGCDIIYYEYLGLFALLKIKFEEETK